MKRIQGSKSAICTKKELSLILELFSNWDSKFYELPLFSMNPKQKFCHEIESDYVLIRPNNNKLTESFFNRINKTWSKIIENESKH
jgi:hypothetical protein